MIRIGKLALMAAFLAVPSSAAFADVGAIFEGGLPSVLEGGLSSADVHVASASLTASPAAAPGPVYLTVDPASGDVHIVSSVTGGVSILSYDLESSVPSNGNGDFIVANWKKLGPDANNVSLSNVLSQTTFDLNQSGNPGQSYLLNGDFDLGNILPAGRTLAVDINDLSDATSGGQVNGPSTYGLPSGSTVPLPVIQAVAVPEPTTLAGLSLIAGGLLARRRRTQK